MKAMLRPFVLAAGMALASLASVLTAQAAQHLQATAEQQEEVRRRLTFPVDDGTLVERAPLTALGDPGQLLLAELLEKEQRADLRDVEGAHASAR